jgi:hypothetical protein
MESETGSLSEEEILDHLKLVVRVPTAFVKGRGIFDLIKLFNKTPEDLILSLQNKEWDKEDIDALREILKNRGNGV